jgi:hypothetical protein
MDAGPRISIQRGLTDNMVSLQSIRAAVVYFSNLNLRNYFRRQTNIPIRSNFGRQDGPIFPDRDAAPLYGTRGIDWFIHGDDR